MNLVEFMYSDESTPLFTKSGKRKKNCYLCIHLDQADFEDYGGGGEFMCDKRKFKSSEDEKEFNYRLDTEEFRSRAKKCCEPPLEKQGGDE